MRWRIGEKYVWRNDKQYIIDWDKPARSKEQTKVQEFLRQYWDKDIVFSEYRLPQTKLRVDFINASKKIALEHQGKGAHNEFNPFFHNNSRTNYLASLKRDIKKLKILEHNGYTVIETFTEDLNKLSKEFFIQKYNICL